MVFNVDKISVKIQDGSVDDKFRIAVSVGPFQVCLPVGQIRRLADALNAAANAAAAWQDNQREEQEWYMHGQVR